MTASDKIYIENEIIAALNEVPARVSAKMHGKTNTVKQFVRVKLADEFPNLLEGAVEDIEKDILARAKRSSYPDEPLGKASRHLNAGEILLLSSLTVCNLQKMKATIEELVGVMRDNDDERAELLAQVLPTLEAIVPIKGNAVI